MRTPFCIIIVFLSLAQVSCNNDAELAKQMVGTWKLDNVKVVVNTIDDGKSGDSTIAADKDHLHMVLGVSASNGTYKADSTYMERYFMMGTMTIQTEGKWYIHNDTLVQMQQIPAADTSKLLLNMMGDSATVQKMLIWGMDSIKNDLFIATLKKAKS